MSSFGSGSTTTAGSSIVLTAFEGTNGVKAGTDGLVPGPAVAQDGYLLGAGGDWVLTTPAIVGIAENSERIATTRFVQAVIANAQIPGGNANLSALGDVGIANLADNQFLQYNDGSGDWENITLTLDTISNVNLAGLGVGQAIVWDGAEWVPGNIGAVNNLNDLGDVTLAGAADKHFLVNNGAGQFVNRLISSGDLSNSANITLADGTVAFTGNVSFGDNNITNVGDVSLDTISADGTTISVSMTDDTGSAFSIKEGNNTYLRVDTTDNSEKVVLEKPTSFLSTTTFENTVVVNEAGNGIDFRVETGTETHALFTSGGTDRVGIFQNNPTVPLDVVGNTKITGDLELTGAITANNLGTASASNVGDFLPSNAGLNDLNGVTIGGVALGVNQVLMYTGANAFENRPFSSTLLSDTGNILRKSSSIGDLADVNLVGLGGGEILVYDENDEEWKPTGQGAVYGDEEARNASGTALANGVHTGITFANDDANDRINATVSLNGFSIRDLSDVANGVLVNGKILKVVNGVLTQADESTITNEQVQDLVGAMVEGNTETDITVSYDDDAGKLNFVVDNTIARLDDPDLTGTPTAPTAVIATNDTQIATTAFVHSLIDSDIGDLNLGTASQSNVADFLASDADINDLGGVSTGGKAEGKILKFNAQNNLVVADDEGKTQEEIEDIVGAMVAGNTETGITVSYVDNDANAGKLNFVVDNTTVGFLAGVQTFTGNKTFTGDVDLTGSNATGATQNASDNSTKLATTAYVDSQIDADIATLDLANTYQAKNARLDDIAGLGVNNNNFIVGDGANLTLETPTEAITSLGMGVANNQILIGTGVNTFGTIATTAGTRTFLASDGSLDGLDGVTIAGNLGNALADGQTLRYDGANTIWKNSKLAFIDLDQNAASTQNVARLNQAQTFTNDITFTAEVDLTGAVATATTQLDADDSTKVATTAFVKNVVAQVGGVSDLDDLTDVTLGADNGNGVAVQTGQVLRISAVDNGVATFRNTQLAYADISGTPVVGQDVQAYNATLQGISALQPVPANRFLYTTGEDTFGEGTISQVGLDILADADAGEVRGTISAQESDATLTALAGLNTGVKQLIYSTANDALEMTGLSDLGKTFIASSVGVNDLSDVLITNVANAQILVYDNDAGENDDQWKNVSLSGDITITNAGVAELADNSVTSAKIEDGSVANAKLQTPYLDLTVGANTDRLNLGETFTIEGTANEIEVSGLADAPGNVGGATLTIGLPDNVTIGGNLEITGNLTVQGDTTTINTATLDVEDTIIRLNKGVAAGANANDIGVFFERGTTGDDAIFYWDEGEDIFKLGTTTNDDHTATDFGATTSFGTLKLATLTTTSDSTVGGALGITGLLNADGGIEIDNGGNKFTVSNAGAVVSVGGITDTTTASAFATGTTIGNLTLADDSITSGGGSISFGDENISFSGNLAINTNKFTVAGLTGNTLIAGTLEVSDVATFTVASVFTAGLSANDSNITNVGDIALDSISADGDAIAIVLDDNVENALVIREGNNNYITVDTTDNVELITFEKNVVFNGTTNISANFDQSITINDSGNDADFRVEGSGQENLLFTDGGNNRVGINTNTPSTQFHVEGNSTFVGATTQSGGHVVFNNGLGNFDFRVAGDNQANLLFVDASTDRLGIRTDTPARVLDVVGDVGISTTLNVAGKTTLVGSLDLTTASSTGITFRSEIAENGNDAGDNVSLLRVNVGGTDGQGNPNYQEVIWNPDMDRFEVESGLKSTGNFAIGNDVATINATTGVTSIKGATTINNSGGTADLIVQNNGEDVLNVDVSAGLTTITGIATVSSQLKTDDLRGLTAGTGNFKIRLEDNVANALEISDATNALSFMTFTTTDDSESITLSQDTIFKKEISIENTNTKGLLFNSNRSAEVSEDATLITVEGGTNKNDVVLAWDTSDNALNLNAESQLHLQGLAGSNALTLGGALVANATIVMTTAGAITLDGTLDSPTINTDKITDKAGNGLEVELADATASALVIRQGNNGESYITINTDALTTTLNQATSFSSTVEITGDTTLDASLKIKYIDGLTTPLILANSDRTGNGEEADALLIEVERGEGANAKIKWDETSDVFEFDKTLSAESNFQVGIDAAAPKATINSTTGNLSTDGTISATSSITTDSVLNFTTASQGAIVFNSDLGNGEAPVEADDFGLTVNRGSQADAKLYWDEGDDAWKIETGNVEITESLVVDSDANGKITISSGQIVSDSGTLSFDDENLTTTGSITSATPALDTNSTTVATTAFVKGQKLGDFDQVDTSGFDTTGQVLVWDQENSTFEVGSAIYNAENARDDVGAALAGGTHTGATTITFTNDDQNDVINLALGITTEDLTDVSSDQATNNQVLRFTTAEGDNQNKYVPTTLGTAADVDTGLSNGNVPTLSTHYHSTKSNEVADLIITGRIIESIDYGQVSEAFNANTDFEFDCGSVTDTGISSWDDYGQLVV